MGKEEVYFTIAYHKQDRHPWGMQGTISLGNVEVWRGPPRATYPEALEEAKQNLVRCLSNLLHYGHTFQTESVG